MGYFKAEDFAEFLRLIHPGFSASGSGYEIFLDNASIHKSDIIYQTAEELG